MGDIDCQGNDLSFPTACGMYYSPTSDVTVTTIGSRMSNFAGLGSGNIYGVIWRIDSMSGSTVTSATQIATSTNTLTFASDVPTWNGSGNGLSSSQFNTFTFSSPTLNASSTYLIGFQTNGYQYLYIGSDSTSCGSAVEGCFVALAESNFYRGARFSGILEGAGAVTESGVQISTPTNQTYNGNPIPFTGTYDNLDSYDRIQFELIFNNNQNMLFNAVTIPMVNGTGLPWSAVRQLTYAGPYTLRARLLDTTTGETTAWSATTTFALNSTTTNPLYVPDAPVSTEECAEGLIYCAITQVLAWAFEPSQESLDRFGSLSEELETRAPFVYIYQVPELYTGIFEAPATASSTIAVTVFEGKPNEHTFVFLSRELLEDVPYTAQIRTILGWLLWFMLLQTFYYQGIRVHDKETKA